MALHNLLSATHPDTLPASPVKGDLVSANSTPAWARFAIGTAGQKLIVDPTNAIPKWVSSNYKSVAPTPNTSVTGTTGIMLGFDLVITPVGSGNVEFLVFGNPYVSASSAGYCYMRYGTGTPPTKGSAVAGTVIGGFSYFQNVTPAAMTIFSNAPSLVIGTAYWFDCELLAAGGTAYTSNAQWGARVLEV